MNPSETTQASATPGHDPRPPFEALLEQVTARSKHWTRLTLEQSARALVSWAEALRRAADAVEPRPETRDGVIPEQPFA